MATNRRRRMVATRTIHAAAKTWCSGSTRAASRCGKRPHRKHRHRHGRHGKHRHRQSSGRCHRASGGWRAALHRKASLMARSARSRRSRGPELDRSRCFSSLAALSAVTGRMDSSLGTDIAPARWRARRRRPRRLLAPGAHWRRSHRRSRTRKRSSTATVLSAKWIDDIQRPGWPCGAISTKANAVAWKKAFALGLARARAVVQAQRPR